LKEYLIQYKPFLLFLAKFFITYLVLTSIYQIYLSNFDTAKNQVDGFTKIVASQSQTILTLVDAKAYTAIDYNEPSIKLFYKGKWVSRIIEGCNALSVIILFISFVVAFTGNFKNTFIFITLGSLLIHLFNIVRIALLSMAVFHFPMYQDFLHSVVFPLFIYGVVFLLWVIWVNKFSNHAKNHS
jgi:exosortase family protein XrtF